MYQYPKTRYEEEGGSSGQEGGGIAQGSVEEDDYLLWDMGTVIWVGQMHHVYYVRSIDLRRSRAVKDSTYIDVTKWLTGMITKHRSLYGSRLLRIQIS